MMLYYSDGIDDSHYKEWEYEVKPDLQDFIDYLADTYGDGSEGYRKAFKGMIYDYDPDELLSAIENDTCFYDWMKERYADEAWEDMHNEE